MKLNFTVDTDDLFDQESLQIGDFESLFTAELKKAVVLEAQARVKTNKFNHFAKLCSDEVIAGIKAKLHSFLDEEIVLTNRWGEPDFIGSIEDLIKQRFDDILLRPVNDQGETLEGCSTKSKTWVEWAIQKELNETKGRIITDAKKDIERSVKKEVNEAIQRLKDSAVKKQVTDAFSEFLRK